MTPGTSIIIFAPTEREATEAFAKACHMDKLQPALVNAKSRTLVVHGNRVLKFRTLSYMSTDSYQKELVHLTMNVQDFYNKYGGGVYGY